MKSILVAQANEPVWEEYIILIEAESEEEANELAAKHGAAMETEYTNSHGEKLKRIFDSISAMHEINGPFKTGCEVFSRFLKNDEVQSIKTKIGE